MDGAAVSPPGAVGGYRLSEVRRWLSWGVRVVGLVALVLIARTHGLLTGRLIALTAFWLALTLGLSLPYFRQVFAGRRIAASGIDLAFGLLCVGQTGLAASPLWWTPLIAGATAGLELGVGGGLGFTGLGSLVWMSWILADGGAAQSDLLPVGQRVAGLAVGGLLVGAATELLRGRSRASGAPRVERRRTADPQAVLHIARQLNASPSGAAVPDLVLDLGVQALGAGADEPAAGLLLAEGTGLRLVAGHGPISAEVERELPGETGLLAQALSSGEPILSRAPAADPELGWLPSLQPFAVALCVPLRNPEQVLGALLFAHYEHDYFTPARIDLLQNLGVQATTALHNARLVRDLEIERDRITETEEEARKKLARDLHDGPTQTIAAIAMRLNYARRLVERDPSAAGEEIHKLEEIARQTTREIRHMLFTLRPLVLESKGLVPALRQLAAKAAETHGQQVILEAEPDSDKGLNARAQGVAFYIAEEAINNARKHAEAEHIWVRVWREGGNHFRLEIQDDGVGFNVGSVDAHYEQRGSLGMVNMRERAELIRASLQLESAEGKGTRITLEVPLDGLVQPNLQNQDPGGQSTGRES